MEPKHQLLIYESGVYKHTHSIMGTVASGSGIVGCWRMGLPCLPCLKQVGVLSVEGDQPSDQTSVIMKPFTSIHHCLLHSHFLLTQHKMSECAYDTHAEGPVLWWGAVQAWVVISDGMGEEVGRMTDGRSNPRATLPHTHLFWTPYWTEPKELALWLRKWGSHLGF